MLNIAPDMFLWPIETITSGDAVDACVVRFVLLLHVLHLSPAPHMGAGHNYVGAGPSS